MATTPEGLVKQKIKAILNLNKIYYAMPVGTGYGNSGVPDFLCCFNGRFIAIEAKAGKGTTTALQDKHLKEITKAGGVSLVVNEDNVMALPGYLDLITKEK